jgi:hypothetical protein
MQNEENNNPFSQSQPAKQAAVPTDAVWISREEYDRLRQAEITQAQSVLPAAAINDIPAQDKQPLSSLMPAVLGLLGIVLFLSFTTPIFSVGLTSFALLIFFGLALISFIDYARNKNKSVTPKQATKKFLKMLALTALILVILPGIFIVGMIILFILVLGFNGGDIGT